MECTIRTAEQVITEDLTRRLDLCVGDLAFLGLYDLADRLEELTGDVEEKLMKRDQ